MNIPRPLCNRVAPKEMLVQQLPLGSIRLQIVEEAMKRCEDEPEYPSERQKYQEVPAVVRMTPLPPYMQPAATSTSRRK